ASQGSAMRIRTLIVLALLLSGPTSVFGTELRVLVSDNSGVPLYGVLGGEVQEGEIRLFSLVAGSQVGATAVLGDEDGAAFDVPPGTYGINVFAPGWLEFEGVIRMTDEPRVVRIALDLGDMRYFSIPPPQPSLTGRVLGLHGQTAWVQLSPIYGPS